MHNSVSIFFFFLFIRFYFFSLYKILKHKIMFPEWAKEILKNSNEDSTDFLYGENTHLEIMIMKSFAETKHGMSLTDACEKYGISIKEFKENFSSVFPGSSFEKDFPNY